MMPRLQVDHDGDDADDGCGQQRDLQWPRRGIIVVPLPSRPFRIVVLVKIRHSETNPPFAAAPPRTVVPTMLGSRSRQVNELAALRKTVCEIALAVWKGGHGLHGREGLSQAGGRLFRGAVFSGAGGEDAGDVFNHGAWSSLKDCGESGVEVVLKLLGDATRIFSGSRAGEQPL